jgi:hypothetical protein
MANKLISGLTPNSVLFSQDLLEILHDPSGTPDSEYVTAGALAALAAAGWLQVYNNSGSPLAIGTAVKFDPSYTSGLGVTVASVTYDQKLLGVVTGTIIGAGASGFIYAPGFAIVQALVKDTTVFGHSLVLGAGGWLVDSGGGGWGPGIMGWALGAQGAGGPNLMNILLHPNPLFYTAAQVITQKYGGNDISSGGATFCASVVNATPNQCLLFAAFSSSGVFTVPLWNVQTPTQLQAGASGTVSYLGAGLGWGAATANFTANWSAGTCVGIALALNGINQGGGAASFGTPAHNNYVAAGGISCTVACVPGDLVVCIILVKATGAPGLSAENQPITEKAVGTNTMYEVMQVMATGNSVTFTATLAGTYPNCDMTGVALHTA